MAAARHFLISHSKLASAQEESFGDGGSSAGDVVVALAVAKHDGVGCVRGDELARRAVLADIGAHSDAAVERGRAKVCVALAAKDEGGDKETIFELLCEGCDEGDCLAMTLRGYCHWEGDGVAQDKQQAIEWWQRAAASGHKEAVSLLKKLKQAKQISNTCHDQVTHPHDAHKSFCL